jgi:hypothetical protein
MVSNDFIILIGIIALGLLLWNLWVSIQIVKYLNANNIKAKIAHQRGKIFRFLPVYKKSTIETTGKPGPLYNLFVLSFVLFSICLFIGFILVSI